MVLRGTNGTSKMYAQFDLKTIGIWSCVCLQAWAEKHTPLHSLIWSSVSSQSNGTHYLHDPQIYSRSHSKIYEFILFCEEGKKYAQQFYWWDVNECMFFIQSYFVICDLSNKYVLKLASATGLMKKTFRNHLTIHTPETWTEK